MPKQSSRFARIVQWLLVVAVALLEVFRMFLCAGCRVQVLICRRCDRGNIYCSAECRNKCRTKYRREAQARYQRTKKGARNHAKRQCRYRARKKNVTDHGSHLSLQTTESPSPTLHEAPRCRFCGRVGSGFVRRGYVRTLKRRLHRDRQDTRGAHSPPLLR